MSTVFVTLGQAGNQLGEQFWALAMEEELQQQPQQRYTIYGRGGLFSDEGFAPCVAVDSEPRVVNRLHALQWPQPALFHRRPPCRSSGDLDACSSVMRPGNVVFDYNGRSNNWAHGFSSCWGGGGGLPSRGGGGGEEGVALFSSTMEALRKEAERCPSFLSAFVLMHSLAGGTGSGVGSALLQQLRDEYPRCYLLSVAMGPFGRGDTPLQHYNSAFALQYLLEYTDVAIYRSNDDTFGRINTAARADYNTQGIGVYMQGLNQGLASDLAAHLLPTTPSSFCSSSNHHQRSSTAVAALSRPFDAGQLVTSCCLLPWAKFLDVRSTASIGSSSATDSAAGSGMTKPSTWSDLAMRLKLRPMASATAGDDYGGVDYNKARKGAVGRRGRSGKGGTNALGPTLAAHVLVRGFSRAEGGGGGGGGGDAGRIGRSDSTGRNDGYRRGRGWGAREEALPAKRRAGRHGGGGRGEVGPWGDLLGWEDDDDEEQQQQQQQQQEEEEEEERRGIRRAMVEPFRCPYEAVSLSVSFAPALWSSSNGTSSSSSTTTRSRRSSSTSSSLRSAALNRSVVPARSISVCANRPSWMAADVQSVLDAARAKHTSGAYLHWYQRYGVEAGDDFEAAFEALQCYVDCCQELTPLSPPCL